MNSIFHSKKVGSWIILFSVAFIGCVLDKKVYLQEPTKGGNYELPKCRQDCRSNSVNGQHVNDMTGRIDIRISKDVAVRNVSPVLRDCLSFLVSEFGPPIYRGEIVLIITGNSSDNNAFMVWEESDDNQRAISLNHYNFIRPEWHHFLIHELFHAFYQSGDFLSVNPDFIVEGLAVYAQFSYRYGGMTNTQIRKEIYNSAVSITPYRNENGIDFDRPFQSYGKGELKYIYLLSGLLFFSQEPGKIREKIRRLLLFPPPEQEKLPFDTIVKIFDLSVYGELFKRGEKKKFALPAPKKLHPPNL